MDKKKLVTGEERAEAADGDVAVGREERFEVGLVAEFGDRSGGGHGGFGERKRREREGESGALVARARCEW